MFSDIRRLGKHASIYTIGNLLTKLAGFLLLPLYTSYLTPADYGTLELLLLAAPIISTALGAGLSQATVRLFYDSEEKTYRKKLVATALYTSFIGSAIGCFILISLSDFFSNFFFKDNLHQDFFILVFYALFFELCMEVPLSFIRVMERSIFFVTVSLMRLLLAISLNVMFLVYLDTGLVGILYSDVITALFAAILLVWTTVRYCGFHYSLSLLKDLFVYGFPLIFVGYGMIALSLVDRYLLSIHVDLTALGIYSLGLKFATLLTIVVVTPFWRSYGPFRFSIMKQDNAKQIYARVFTYYIIVSCWAALGLSLLGREVVFIMTDELFWDAYKIIPYLSVGLIFYGTYYMVQTGIYINKKTKYIGYIMNSVALVKIAIAWWLIKEWGVYGAGVSSIIGFLLLSIITYVVAQKIYPISYEWWRVVKVILLMSIAYIAGVSLEDYNLWIVVLIKLMILMAIPVIIVWGRILHDDEKAIVLNKLSILFTKLKLRHSDV